MERAAFSLDRYIFNQVAIDLENFSKEKGFDINFSVDGAFDEENKTYLLRFQTSIVNEESKETFIYVNCLGYYDFKGVDKKEEIPDYFFTNSIPIIFPFVRAYINLITTQANLPGILLPTYNLSSLGEELKKNTR